MYDSDHLAQLDALVRDALSLWSLAPGSDVRLLTVSENATYLLTDAGSQRRLVLRVHRPAYHTRHEIASELAWIDALRRDGVVRTPAAIAAADGTLIQILGCGATQRYAVAFAFVEGHEPEPGETLPEWFRQLGAITARMHLHARGWARPRDFRRKVWDFSTALGDQPHWGRWRDGIGLTRQGTALLARTTALIEARLAAYGTAPERFGVVHADLRLANLLVQGAELSVIDFDDCGLSWFMYDFAAAISFIEHLPIVPALQAAWVAGYRGVAPLDEADARAIPVMVMMRRILLVAWIASHRETPTAQAAGEEFTSDTLSLAEAFLTADR